jgi:hypothetical protein
MRFGSSRSGANSVLATARDLYPTVQLPFVSQKSVRPPGRGQLKRPSVVRRAQEKLYAVGGEVPEQVEVNCCPEYQQVFAFELVSATFDTYVAPPHD